MEADSVTALATAVMAVATVGAAWIGVGTLLATKRDSRDRSRPMVAAYLERDPHPTGMTADLVVKNFGPSVAYNVRVEFDPPLVAGATKSGQNSVMPFLLNRYSADIPNLVPQKELRSLWFIFNREESEVHRPVNDEPIPSVVRATIFYTDRPDQSKRGVNKYSGEFVLDSSIFGDDLIGTHSDGPHELRKKSTKATEGIKKSLDQVAKMATRIDGYLMPEEERQRRADADRAALERRR